MKYYPARLASRHPGPKEALISIGFLEDAADLVIANAALNQSPEIFAHVDEDHGVVLTRLADGQVGLWRACMRPLWDTAAEAQNFARQIESKLQEDGEFPHSQWAIFQWSEPISSTAQ